MKLRARRGLDTALALFLASPVLLVSIVLHVLPGTPERLVHHALLPIIGFLGLGLLGFGFYLCLKLEKFPLFIGFSILCTVAGILLAGFLSLRLHREFFSALIQYILAFPFLFLAYIRRRAGKGFSTASLRSLSIVGIVIAAFYAQWILMMGYAIATRAEPRPIQSLLYNSYNIILAVALALLSRSIEMGTWKRLIITEEGLTWDDKDLEPILGQKKMSMLRAFALAPERILHCPELQRIIHKEGEEAGSCAECAERETKATLCQRYRATYNSLLDIKRTLEFLGIGTITSPENKRRILTEGWKLLLFEDVRLQSRDLKPLE